MIGSLKLKFNMKEALVCVLDFDRTICCGKNVQQIRNMRRRHELPWDCYKNAYSELLFYGNIPSQIKNMYKSNLIKIIVISELPRHILEGALKYHNIPYNECYGYHDFFDKNMIRHPRPSSYIFDEKIFPKYGNNKLKYILFGNNFVDV